MKGNDEAPTPDPAIGQAALRQSQLGEEWLSFAKDQFAISNERQVELDAQTKRVTDLQIGIATDQSGWQRDDRKRYEETFRPIEDEFVAEASTYGSPERQAEAAAAARADVQTAAANARAAARREAAAVGIDPASGRYAGIERAGELGTALADAGAANSARTMVRDKGLALKADVVNLGRGLPAQSAQAAGVGIAAGNSAVGNTATANSQFNASTGIVDSGYRGAMAGASGQANTLSNLHGMALDTWDAQNKNKAANASGIGSFIGGAAGLIFSDEDAKTDKTPIAEGEALEAVKTMPVEEWNYMPGIADEGRHVGTYAQDFKRATGKGSGKTIPVQDAIGISMKAIQDLDRKMERIAEAVGISDRRAAA